MPPDLTPPPIPAPPPPLPAMATFGATLQRVRERHGLTAEQMAEAVGVPVATFTAWEADDELPETKMQTKLSLAIERGGQ